MDQPEQSSIDFAELTASIVAAYVSKHSVPVAELSGVIATVHSALRGLNAPASPQPENLQPAVPIRKSVTPDFIISLEDGKSYKSLKRHLTGLGLTPDQYRQKWGLPSDYPMVSANYARQRSELAKSIGLGQSRGKHTASADGAGSEDAAKSGTAKRRAPGKRKADK